jgi:peptide/nickel transport system permease protein
MIAFVARRVLSTIPVLILVSFAVYGFMLLIPGNPAVTIAGGVNATPAQVTRVEATLHLNEPFLVQYWHWVVGALHLNFGNSLYNGESVAQNIFAKLPVTASIVLGAMVFGIVVGGATGVFAGMRPGSRTDRTLMSGAALGLAIPGFLLAMVLLWLFAVKVHWFPVIGYTSLTQSPLAWLRSIILPSIALGVWIAASTARQLRGDVADTMQLAYIRTAWAKGASTSRVVGKHALKNAVIPVITLTGLQLAGLMGGTVIIEQLFSIPGLGSYLLTGITDHDMPVVMGGVIVFVVLYLVIGLAVDAAYTLVNPKVRLS